MQEELTPVTTGSLVLTLCLGILLIVLPRRYALAPMLIAGCYMTLGQVLIVGGLHFYLIRILILFGLIRLVVRKEILSVKLNGIDKLLIAWVVVQSFLYVLFDGSNVSLIERLGAAYNALGIYFLIRAVVWNLEDVVHDREDVRHYYYPSCGSVCGGICDREEPIFDFWRYSQFSKVRNGQFVVRGRFCIPSLQGHLEPRLYLFLWDCGYTVRAIGFLQQVPSWPRRSLSWLHHQVDLFSLILRA